MHRNLLKCFYRSGGFIFFSCGDYKKNSQHATITHFAAFFTQFILYFQSTFYKLTSYFEFMHVFMHAHSIYILLTVLFDMEKYKIVHYLYIKATILDKTT